MTTRQSLARAWHVLTVTVIAAAMIAQLLLVVQDVGVLVDQIGNSAPLPVRLLRFFSYFTIQSNLLAAFTAASLIARPDRDGRSWRILRIAALVGMTVTFIVYMIALRPLVHLQGTARLCDIGFHYVAPILTVLGWLLFGPWPRIDTRSLLRHLVWPVTYLLYIFGLGSRSGWYPYPFVNAVMIGYSRALLNALVIAMGILAVAAILQLLDTVRGGAKARPIGE